MKWQPGGGLGLILAATPCRVSKLPEIGAWAPAGLGENTRRYCGMNDGGRAVDDFSLGGYIYLLKAVSVFG